MSRVRVSLERMQLSPLWPDLIYDRHTLVTLRSSYRISKIRSRLRSMSIMAS